MVELENDFPAVQNTHDELVVAPMSKDTLPVEQVLHETDATLFWSWYCPIGHAWQGVVELPKDFPAEQKVHAMEPVAKLIFPVGQLLQEIEAMSL